MSKCAACPREAQTGETLCSYCRWYIHGDKLLSDPGLNEIQSDLGKAVKWLFHTKGHAELRCLADAKELITQYRARDLVEIEKKVVESLIGMSPSPDPWSVEILHPITMIIGAPLNEVRGYVKDLEERGVIQIEPSEHLGVTWKDLQDATPFPRLRRWVKCDQKKGKDGPGTEKR